MRADTRHSLHMRDLNRGREQADVRVSIELKNAATDLMAAVNPYR